MTAQPLDPTRGGWVASPAWDLSFMFSAVWGSALCLLLGYQVGPGPAVATLFAWNWLIAILHSFSTTYMVVASPLMRGARQRNRLKFTWAPLAIAAGCVALGWSIGVSGGFPESFPLGPGQALWIFYLALFWVGHFWHFGNQDFGVLSIYRGKSGQSSPLERRADKAYAVAMMFAIQPIVYLSVITRSPWSEAVRSVVPLSEPMIAGAANVAVAAAGILTLAIVAFELRKPASSLPKLLYYGVMFSHPLVLYLIDWQLAAFYTIAYFWSHWFIAIGLVGRINTNYYRGRGSSLPRALFFHLATFGWFALAGALFHLFFGNYSVFSGRNYKELLSAVGPEWQGIIGLLLGVFLAEQLVHYYCDRCLFRFRDPDVRRAVAPLI